MTKTEQERIINSIVFENEQRLITATSLNRLLKLLLSESYDADIALVRTKTHPTNPKLIRVVLVDKAQREITQFDIPKGTMDYNDLTNTPDIPNSTSDLTNDSGFITSDDVPEQVQSDWSVTNTTSKAYIRNKPMIPSALEWEEL